MWPLVLDEIPVTDGTPLAEIYDENFTEEPSEVQFWAHTQLTPKCEFIYSEKLGRPIYMLVPGSYIPLPNGLAHLEVTQ